MTPHYKQLSLCAHLIKWLLVKLRSVPHNDVIALNGIFAVALLLWGGFNIARSKYLQRRGISRLLTAFVIDEIEIEIDICQMTKINRNKHLLKHLIMSQRLHLHLHLHSTCTCTCTCTCSKLIPTKRSTLLWMLGVLIIGILVILWAWRIGPFATSVQQLTIVMSKVNYHFIVAN